MLVPAPQVRLQIQISWSWRSVLRVLISNQIMEQDGHLVYSASWWPGLHLGFWTRLSVWCTGLHLKWEATTWGPHLKLFFPVISFPPAGRVTAAPTDSETLQPQYKQEHKYHCIQNTDGFVSWFQLPLLVKSGFRLSWLAISDRPIFSILRNLYDCRQCLDPIKDIVGVLRRLWPRMFYVSYLLWRTTMLLGP